jgi:hypothetical protein
MWNKPAGRNEAQGGQSHPAVQQNRGQSRAQGECCGWRMRRAIERLCSVTIMGKERPANVQRAGCEVADVVRCAQAERELVEV